MLLLTGQQDHQIKIWIVAFLVIVAVFFLFKLLGFDELTQRHPPLYNAKSRGDVKIAYTHAQAYFSDYSNYIKKVIAVTNCRTCLQPKSAKMMFGNRK